MLHENCKLREVGNLSDMTLLDIRMIYSRCNLEDESKQHRE